METTIYKKIELENKQQLVISDMSRKIGEDAFVVRMKAQIEIQMKKELFDDPLFADQEMTDTKYNDILDAVGPQVMYEYSIERNFILSKDKDTVFESLVDTFMENLGQYVAKPQFPGKLVLKEYKDKTK